MAANSKTSEMAVFNDFRLLLETTRINVLQLVAPGGQSPLSVTYKCSTRRKLITIFPDFIGVGLNAIYIGELKPKFSSVDYDKLMSLVNSENAVLSVKHLVERKLRLEKVPEKLTPLLIHADKDSANSSDIAQFVLVGDNEALIKAQGHKVTLKKSKFKNLEDLPF